MKAVGHCHLRSSSGGRHPHSHLPRSLVPMLSLLPPQVSSSHSLSYRNVISHPRSFLHGQQQQQQRHRQFTTGTTELGSIASTLSTSVHAGPQPYHIVKSDLDKMRQNILHSVATDHPLLETMAQYYFTLEGKQFRPMILLLLARALAAHFHQDTVEREVDARQLQLAEIVEMIHTASIVHDDVVDEAATRRGSLSINSQFGNKLAILSGDYLLARASVRLSALENFEITRLISTVIADLVEGELMQVKPSPDSTQGAFDYYLKKTYLKTGSLIANGCRCIALLSSAPTDMVQVATEYGRNLGLAFQLVDDMLDFTSSETEMGKPAGLDLNLGLATAPVLFAREEYPELSIFIARKFEQEGDVEKTRNFVNKSKGIEKTKELALSYGVKAVEALEILHASSAKEALIEIVRLVLNRNK